MSFWIVDSNLVSIPGAMSNRFYPKPPVPTEKELDDLFAGLRRYKIKTEKIEKKEDYKNYYGKGPTVWFVRPSWHEGNLNLSVDRIREKLEKSENKLSDLVNRAAGIANRNGMDGLVDALIIRERQISCYWKGLLKEVIRNTRKADLLKRLKGLSELFEQNDWLVDDSKTLKERLRGVRELHEFSSHDLDRRIKAGISSDEPFMVKLKEYVGSLNKAIAIYKELIEMESEPVTESNTMSLDDRAEEW
jgi:hypothetical protein